MELFASGFKVGGFPVVRNLSDVEEKSSWSFVVFGIKDCCHLWKSAYEGRYDLLW